MKEIKYFDNVKTLFKFTLNYEGDLFFRNNEIYYNDKLIAIYRKKDIKNG